MVLGLKKSSQRAEEQPNYLLLGHLSLLCSDNLGLNRCLQLLLVHELKLVTLH